MKSLIFKIVLFASLLLLCLSCGELFTNTDLSNLQGEWSCSEKHDYDGYSTYDISIDIDEADSTTILVYNFLNLETNPTLPRYVRMSVIGNSITIPYQSIGNHFVEGSGEISDDFKKISLTFTDNLYGNSEWNVTSNYTKK